MNEKNYITGSAPGNNGEDLPAEQRLRVHGKDYTFAVDPEELQAAIAVSEQTTKASAPGVPDSGEDDEFGIIGQPRALRALRMALKIRNRGYNVIVTGPAGVGKRTAVKRVLAGSTADMSGLRDIAYVHNFSCPAEPRVLYFEPGTAQEFRSGLADCVAQIKLEIELLTEDRNYVSERDALLQSVQTREAQSIAEFEDRVGRAGFRVDNSPGELTKTELVPLLGGEPVRIAELEREVVSGNLTCAVLEEIRTRYYSFLDEMHRIIQRLRHEREKNEGELIKLRRKAIGPAVAAATGRLAERFSTPAVRAYLDEFSKDVLENVALFIGEGATSGAEVQAGVQGVAQAAGAETCAGSPLGEHLQRYGVNIVVDHTNTTSAPVVFESNPDYQTMFGSSEPMHAGEEPALPGYMSLRVGAVAKASGGFLVLRAEDLFSQEDVWQACKRVLQDGITEIRSIPGSQSAPGFLRPEPIEVSFKLIVTAAEHVYDALYENDEEIGKLFKVTAEFDSVMPRNADTTARYIAFIRMVAAQEALLEPDRSGIAAILEHAVRLSEFRNLYSTRFSRIADLLRESDYCARRNKASSISSDSVEATVAERAYLSNLPEEKIDEQILSGELLVTVSGMAVGRINGLAILDRGYYAFARPMLITARTAPGSEGIVNIERESGLSGEIHDKGVYILEGYIRSKYAQDFPLSVRGSICFEQSYIEVDGDSASSSEVYVMLSAIAELPLRQDIAVTGSVNQLGQIQAVGGINEKIEGFYEVCRKLGLTGSQGVIIPRGNIANLMPSRTLQRALDEAKFHVWSVATVDEAMEILTGLEAGGRTLKGGFRGGSVNALVERRLREMAQQMKSFGAL